MNHKASEFMKTDRDTDIAMFEALFVAIKTGFVEAIFDKFLYIRKIS